MAGGDVALVASIWGLMLKNIADESGHEKDKAFWVKIAGSATSAGALIVGGTKIVMGILAYSGVGTGAAIGINCFMNGFYTWRLGKAAAELFDKPGVDLNDAAFLVKALVSALKPMPTKKDVVEFYDILKSMGIA